MLGLRRTAPAVPGSLVAVVAGYRCSSTIFGLDDHGVAIVGHIDSGLPSFGSRTSRHDYGSPGAGGVGVMLVGFAEGLGAAKTYARREDYEIDTNRELIGLGARNLGSGPLERHGRQRLLSKTAVNGSAGAHTQLSGLVVAVLTVVTLLLLTGLFEKLPDATLAAVVIAAVIELVDFPPCAPVPDLRRPAREPISPSRRARTSSPRSPRCSACCLRHAARAVHRHRRVAAPAALPRLATARRRARPGAGRGPWVDVRRHPDARRRTGSRCCAIEGGLFFANADAVRARVPRRRPGNCGRSCWTPRPSRPST